MQQKRGGCGRHGGGGGRWSAMNDTINPLATALDHELAHVIDIHNDLKLSTQYMELVDRSGFTNMISSQISDYATASSRELFAEVSAAIDGGILIPQDWQLKRLKSGSILTSLFYLKSLAFYKQKGPIKNY